MRRKVAARRRRSHSDVKQLRISWWWQPLLLGGQVESPSGRNRCSARNDDFIMQAVIFETSGISETTSVQALHESRNASGPT